MHYSIQMKAPMRPLACTGGAVSGLGGDAPPTVYRVAWKVLSPGAERPQAPLAVYWFPTSPDEARSSAWSP